MYNRSTLASAPVDAASAGAAGLPARIAAKANLMSQIDDEHLVTLALSAVKVCNVHARRERNQMIRST